MKVALTNMDIVCEDKEANKKQCLLLTKNAAEQQADFILFPEMTLSGFSLNVEKIADNEGETIAFFSDLSKKYNISIGFGYVTKPDEKGRNHFVIIDKKGTVVMDFEKIHPFTYGGEADCYEGGNNLGYFEGEDGWKCAGFVCYDLRFPETFQKLPDTDVIFIIANWPESRVNQWYSLLQARAIEMQSYVVGVNRIGEEKGVHYTKSSEAYDPKGHRIPVEIPLNMDMDEDDTNTYVTLDKKARRCYVKKFPVRKDRRLGFDYE